MPRPRQGRSSTGHPPVAVRRWDDLAKDPAAVVAGFAHYRTLLADLMAEHAARAAAAGR
ncbi:hypothetical protein [Actinacidiphila alni]|uniref:hypothetical protein n=1 Tax=Actinacidiphila alni TaxID=380248 RepID=UPI0015A5FF8D|nr:hypothetical protein [Actinacidiphila alni]